MNDTHIKTLAQVHAFLEGTQTVTFSLQTKTERYAFSCMASYPPLANDANRNPMASPVIFG